MPTATAFRDQAQSGPPVEAWVRGEPIDARLFHACRGLFAGSVLREILLAAAGLKVSRLSLDDAGKTRLQRLAERHGFSVIEGRLRYLHVGDAGKGLFTNKARLASSGELGGSTFSYVAQSVERAAFARDVAEAGNANGFGALLGIPDCCREAYSRFEPIARKMQGDLVPQVWQNTPSAQPFDPWINVVVRYFGMNLISFFPCSFSCLAANAVARHTYRLLADVSPDWADALIDHQNANVLYTEHQGIHAIRSPLVGNTICYEPDQLVSTQDTRAARLIRSGNRLEIVNGHSVAVHRDAIRLGSIEGPNVFACVFRRASIDHDPA